MLEFPRWKVWLVSLVVAIGVLLSVPSLIAGTPYANAWPKWLPQYKISLGLDLAGGSHLLLEADQVDAQKTRLQAMEDSVSTELRRDPLARSRADNSSVAPSEPKRREVDNQRGHNDPADQFQPFCRTLRVPVAPRERRPQRI